MVEHNKFNEFKGHDIWDDKGMMERMLGDANLAKLIVEQFLMDSESQLNELSDFITEGDLGMIRQRAHSVKGASANVGGEQFREIAQAIEVAASAQNLERTRQLLPLLNESYDELRRELRNYLNT